MALGGFTLADRLGAKTLPCRVTGCTRTLIQLSNKALTLGGGVSGDPNHPSAGMCEPCKTKYLTLHDQERRCDRPGCAHTWSWPVQAQIEAFAAKRQPPRRLCSGCESTLAALQDLQIPCAVPGCGRKSTLTRHAQLLGATADNPTGAPAAPTETPSAAPANVTGAPDATEGKPRRKVTIAGLMCKPCAEVAARLSDRAVHCGITGCKRKWIWKADEQIVAFAAGKTSDPPRRMCEPCRASFGKLIDREVRCRTSGCKKTWTWSRGDQLDACAADQPSPKAPQKMCKSCFDLFSGLKDVERPCRKAGCKRTWTDKRGAQLARAVRGKVGDPYPHYCSECEKELGDLSDREIGCKTEGCPGTWTWSKEQQLAAGVHPVMRLDQERAEPRLPSPESVAATPVLAPELAHPEPSAEAASAAEQPPAAEEPVVKVYGRGENRPSTMTAKRGRSRDRRKRKNRQPKPPAKLCGACVEFLKDRKTLEIPCSQCGTPIYWPPESQLQTHLGNWAVPGLCGACKRDATELARQAAREALRLPGAHLGNPGEAAPPPPLPAGDAEAVPRETAAEAQPLGND